MVEKEEIKMRKEISNIIKEWKDEAGVKGIVLVSVYSSFRDTIKICTDRPGLMVGKGGKLVDKYREKLKTINKHLEHIEFVETDNWYIRQQLNSYFKAELEVDYMRTKSLNNAKLIIRVIGNKHTKEIITENVFDNREQKYWTDERIQERGIRKFLNMEDMKETLNWNLNGNSSKYQFKWGQGTKDCTEGVAYIFDQAMKVAFHLDWRKIK